MLKSGSDQRAFIVDNVGQGQIYLANRALVGERRADERILNLVLKTLRLVSLQSLFLVQV